MGRKPKDKTNPKPTQAPVDPVEPTSDPVAPLADPVEPEGGEGSENPETQADAVQETPEPIKDDPLKSKYSQNRPMKGKPNVPCFDYDEKGKPVLLDGEDVVAKSEKEGVTILGTNRGRRIFMCSLDEFEAKFTVLNDRKLYELHYPVAAKSGAK